MFRLHGELLLVAHPTRSNQERRCPNALAPNKDLGLPELFTIANAPVKVASLLS